MGTRDREINRSRRTRHLWAVDAAIEHIQLQGCPCVQMGAGAFVSPTGGLRDTVGSLMTLQHATAAQRRGLCCQRDLEIAMWVFGDEADIHDLSLLEMIRCAHDEHISFADFADRCVAQLDRLRTAVSLMPGNDGQY